MGAWAALVGAWAALVGAWAAAGLVEAPGLGLVDSAAAAALGLVGDAAQEGRFSTDEILHGLLQLQDSNLSSPMRACTCTVNSYAKLHTGKLDGS